MPRSLLADARNDIFGGLVSAAVAIPLAMGFGMFAFVSLGDQYFANGALAGLYTAFILGLACVLLGDRTPTVYAPRITTTFFLGLVLFKLVHADATAVTSAGLPLTLAIFATIILLGGAFQLLFGLIRLGTLIKFVPHPVMAGFQNAAALLLFLVQLGNVLGFANSTPFVQALVHLEQAKPLSILVAAATFAVTWCAPRLLPRTPTVVVGLAFGSAVYYALTACGLSAQLGPIIGNAPFAALEPSMVPDFTGLLANPDLVAMLPTILGAALALAMIAAIDALLCAKLLTRPGDPKNGGDRLLIRLGLANIAAACFGGITGGLNIGPSLANRAFGGRTPLSVLVNALAILIACMVLFPLATALPRVALSAVIMVIAVQHLDRWTLRVLRHIASGSTDYRRKIMLDLLVVLLVAILSIAMDIVAAVFIGVLIAVVLFVVRMSRSVVRRAYRGDTVRSRKSRSAAEMAALERDGGAILVLELQGALFFGSAETLAGEIAKAAQSGARYVILDLRRVTEIDSTGSQILVEIKADLASRDGHLILALMPRSDTAEQLADAFVLDAVPAERIFQDADRAIEWAEDRLLGGRRDAPAADGEIPPDQINVLRGLAAADIAAIRSHLSRASYPRGSVIFHEGDPGTEIFIIARGTASAYLRQADGGDIRLVTFAPGTLFGELAILDEGTRSASVVADEDLVCHVLTGGEFAALCAQAPSVAIKLLRNLGRELSGRLRTANRTIHQLEI